MASTNTYHQIAPVGPGTDVFDPSGHFLITTDDFALQSSDGYFLSYI